MHLLCLWHNIDLDTMVDMIVPGMTVLDMFVPDKVDHMVVCTDSDMVSDMLFGIAGLFDTTA
jgi:hypothetical protein